MKLQDSASKTDGGDPIFNKNIGKSRSKFAHAMLLYVFSRFQNSITLAGTIFFQAGKSSWYLPFSSIKNKKKHENRTVTPRPLNSPRGDFTVLIGTDR